MGVVYAQALSGAGPVPWRTVILGPLVYELIWLLLTPVVFWLAASFDLTAGPRGRLVALLVHACASVGLPLLFRVLYLTGLVLVGTTELVFSWTTVLASVNVWHPGY
jgi:two-component system LytT family sensor kinase